MSIKLEDYQELLDGLPPEAVQVLHSSWVEATKSFSARGLDNYLKAASAINQLGRGAASGHRLAGRSATREQGNR